MKWPCGHMDSTRPLQRRERAAAHCNSHTTRRIPANFLYASQRKKAALFICPCIPLSLFFFLSLFNPSLYFRRERKKKQNTKPGSRSALVAKSERACVFFFSFFLSFFFPPCAELSLESLWKIASFE